MILPCRFAAKPGSGPATRIWAQELLPLTNNQNNFQDIAVIAIVAVSALLSVIAIASVIAVIAIVAVSAIVSVVLVGLHGGEGKSLLLQPLATVLGEDYVQEAPSLRRCRRRRHPDKVLTLIPCFAKKSTIARIVLMTFRTPLPPYPMLSRAVAKESRNMDGTFLRSGCSTLFSDVSTLDRGEGGAKGHEDNPCDGTFFAKHGPQ